ncbi:MAG: hypothetical protein RAP70_07955 [Candidatus Celaenobacter antarcticus]|nr:hypothetical protein [Candidatus Celaenobacter antarcticus]
MEKEIVDYKIVRVRPISASTDKIESTVRDLIKKGWQPIGGVSLSASIQAQALVKYGN